MKTLTAETRLMTATEVSYVVAFAAFSLRKTGSFHWPNSRAIPTISFERLFHKLRVFKKPFFFFFFHFEPLKVYNIFFSTHYVFYFFLQLLTVCTLPKSEEAPCAFDKTENIGALQGKLRGLRPGMFPHHREHPYIWHWVTSVAERSNTD